ncbi:tRNA (adenosine(37)-N6)-dimethylallyltransferase MiaA [Bdellovibrio sp. 22V]|uniref:tRNA (adenosine(37)-N6)-dimethylallyltransferase MiaA n=1 Tax=Bdellovibrio sp. 22V TaxID=3044166 RepID=UPI002543F0B1|nr:tRNA (adenosine(37)-N6)-dimethylallyltransferase MiaA [Bdellovibrio sp. 22V]WII71947.1 tRNA (adenosine(37)-N6)-dimethylallyltransferase MiaA [Bdellovibrio sp. 22V]
MKNSKKPVIFVVGATATGKSDWALKLAQEFRGVIINCDSVQVYKKLDIGSAKPSRAERSLVPHYLLDYVSPPQEMTAGQYSRDFHELMEKLPENTPAFVVGGTGFYFMAIEKGMYPVVPVPAEIQKAVADELAQEGGSEKLHRELLLKDPEYGAKIHVSDHYRIGRAIELIRSQGKSVTAIQEEFASSRSQFPYPLLKIGPQWDRDVLKKRIDLRTKKMLEQGLVAEVQALLDEGLERWAPMSSVGYKETIAHVKGELSSEQLFEEIAKNTRQLAKRQRTWFQRDKEIHWFAGDSGFPEARALVEKFLTS